MKSARNSRISVVRANDPDHPQERPGFKFFKRCDIRDTAWRFLSKDGVHGWRGGQHFQNRRIHWHIQRAPGRSGWRNSGKHIRTGSNLRAVWFHRARGPARNGSGDRRGIEEAKDEFQITQDEKERMALGRVRRDLGFRRGATRPSGLPDMQMPCRTGKRE
eukprot:13130388-Heterocapsa_arctica.AAC.1